MLIFIGDQRERLGATAKAEQLAHKFPIVDIHLLTADTKRGASPVIGFFHQRSN